VKKKGFEMTREQADAHQRKHGFPPLIKQEKLPELIDTISKVKRKLRVGTRKMNQTEREFEVLLNVQKMNKQILDFRFEGVVLQWGDGMRFKADFSVLQITGKTKLIEVKGKHIWKHAIVRFKGCRAEWKQWFDFEFWQKDTIWQQLL
jgi:hypothetical protein